MGGLAGPEVKRLNRPMTGLQWNGKSALGASGPTLVAHVSLGGAGTTTAINTTGATLIAIAVGFYVPSGASVGGLTDSKSNAYTGLAKSGISDAQTQIFVCTSPTVGTGHTFTVSGANFPAICVAAFSGTLNGTTADVNVANFTSTATTVQPGSATPAHNGELVLTSAGTSASGLTSVDSGFTITDNVAGVGGVNMPSAFAYLVQGTAAALNPTWTGPSGNMSASMASIQHA